MKKIFTLLAGVAVSAAGFAAVPNVQTQYRMTGTPSPERLSQVRAEAAAAFYDPSYRGDYTRTWTDNKGNVWDLSLSMINQPLGEYYDLRFKEDEPPADIVSLPYYPARYMLRKLNADQSAVVDGVIFMLQWPTKYLAEQIYTYDGEPDAEGSIPVEKRDFTPMLPSVLFNSSDMCREFVELKAGMVGGDMNQETGQWESWGIMNNDWIGSAGLYNGKEAVTVVTDTKASTLNFRSYDLTGSVLEVRNRIYMESETNSDIKINNTFSGTADVEGFEPRYVTTPDFGSVHVFNTGTISSDKFGLNNPFTEEFESVTAFYVVGADPAFEVGLAPNATEFSVDNVGLKRVKDEIASTEVNAIIGYAFADAKYGNDINLDPKEMIFRLYSGEVKEEAGEPYLSIAPKVNSFVAQGYNYEWSELYGMEVDNENKIIYVQGENENEFGWGTTEGFSLRMHSMYDRFITTKSTEDIIYHYDPKNITKVRKFSSIGSLPPSEVESIVADNAAQIVARDGQISVVAGEVAPIAVYTLDGKLVKAANAAELNVEAGKGVYVVRVADKATKVVL